MNIENKINELSNLYMVTEDDLKGSLNHYDKFQHVLTENEFLAYFSTMKHVTREGNEVIINTLYQILNSFEVKYNFTDTMREISQISVLEFAELVGKYALGKVLAFITNLRTYDEQLDLIS